MKFLERLEEKMGSYLNPSKLKFEESLRSEIYVDKTGLLTYTNSVISTRQKYLCVSRPRRFGKSMAVEMLAAYYSRGADSGELFQGYKIAESSSFHTYLNRYDVIAINMQEFLSKSSSVEELIELLQKRVLHEVLKVYRDIEVFAPSNLQWTMQDIYQETGIPFIILIDEWDCIFREYQVDAEAQRKYLDFLRDLLKDKEYVALAYMTGILPIKKYGSHSALNMFQEFSMTDPAMLAEFVGFTEKEVRGLCERYRMSFEETKSWYDGYCFPQEQSVYSPKSVVEAMLRRNFNTYWNQTETFEALKIYIQMNYEGLRDAVVEMIAGGRVKINTGSFNNDMTTFHNADDVMTLLVHLGYLAYDMTTKEVFIPNREVCSEYINAVKVAGWNRRDS